MKIVILIGSLYYLGMFEQLVDVFEKVVWENGY